MNTMASSYLPPPVPYIIPKIKSGPKLGKLGLEVKIINSFDINGKELEYILLDEASDAAVVLPTPSIIKSVNGNDVKPPTMDHFIKLILESGLDAIPMELIPLPSKWTEKGNEK